MRKKENIALFSLSFPSTSPISSLPFPSLTVYCVCPPPAIFRVLRLDLQDKLRAVFRPEVQLVGALRCYPRSSVSRSSNPIARTPFACGCKGFCSTAVSPLPLVGAGAIFALAAQRRTRSAVPCDPAFAGLAVSHVLRGLGPYPMGLTATPRRPRLPARRAAATPGRSEVAAWSSPPA